MQGILLATHSIATMKDRRKMQKKYSVLMSIYCKEKASNLRASIESLINQTVQASEIVIVKDGALTEELEETLSKYIELYPNKFNIVTLGENKGLGLALAEGIKHCSNELVARMDSDDISVHNRFELQLKEFEKDPELDICGGYIGEFCDDPNKIVSVRKVPLNDLDIKKYQKRRDGLNHVTVMYKKSKVVEAGNYQHALFMEDSLLWANMFLAGAKCMNIPKTLVYVRTGEGMYQRRGGFSYFLKYRQGRKLMYKTGYISKFDYYYTIFIQAIIAMLPSIIRKYIYNSFLRSRYN